MIRPAKYSSQCNALPYKLIIDFNFRFSVTTSTSTAENADFLGVTTSVTFSTGETGPKSIIIDLVDDLVVEPPETFTVALTSSSPLTLGPAASVNIIDNDSK